MAGSQPVQSVARASELLKLVGRSADGLTLQQLAQQTGLKPPTIHHLARTLVQAQLLEKVAQPTRYRIGPAIFTMVQQRVQQKLRQDAREVLTQLARALPDATVTVAEWQGGEVVVVLRITPEQPELIQEPVHQAMSPYSSASSLVFQAFCSPEQRQSYRLRYPFEDYGMVWKHLRDLDAYLAQGRSQGCIVRPGPQDTIAAAAPVFGPGGQLAAMLGAALRHVSPNQVDAHQSRIVQALLEAAHHLGQMQAELLPSVS